MLAAGEPLMQIGDSKTPSRALRVGKVLGLFSLFLGVACVTLWAFGTQQVGAAEPATSMAMAQPMQMQKLQNPMQQVPPRNFMNRIAALKRSDDVPAMTKREMMAATIASAAVALPGAANAANDAASVQMYKPDLKQQSGRFGLLALAPATAVGWVLFNIFGPALNQLDDMGDKNDARDARKR